MRSICCYGADGDSADLTVQSANGAERVVSLPRKAAYRGNVWRVDGTESFRLLPSGFGYMDLRLLMPHQVDTAFDALETTKGLIFDMRGYPNGTSRAIASRLSDKAEVPSRCCGSRYSLSQAHRRAIRFGRHWTLCPGQRLTGGKR